MTRATPRQIAHALESAAALPDVPDRERLRGYVIPGVPFESGHILAMRRFPATSIGPGYTSIWHRDPGGRWVIYQDQDPRFSCPRAFGPAIDDAPVVPISIDWTGPCELDMTIDTDEVRLHWHIPLTSTRLTRAVSAAASVMPAAMRRHPAALAAVGRLAGTALRAGRIRLAGDAPSGQRFAADLRQIWFIDGTSATIDGVDLGAAGPTDAQAHLADFWIPQRGMLAVADAFFDPSDPQRHLQVASRRDLTSNGATDA